MNNKYWISTHVCQHSATYTVARLTQGAPARDALHFKSASHLVIHLVRTGDIDLVVLMLAGQTNGTTTLDQSLPTSGNRPFCVAVVERHAGPSWLRDHDDDNTRKREVNSGSRNVIGVLLCV